MKLLLIKHFACFLLCLSISLTSWSQKYALEGDTNRFVCKSDSLKHVFKSTYLDRLEVDTLLELHYWYSNGRYEQEVMACIWMNDKRVKLKAIYGCDDVRQTRVIDYPNSQIFIDYIDSNLWEEEHHLNSSWSHEFGYSFNLRYGDFQRAGYVRDSNLGENNFEEETTSIKATKRKIADQNPLVKWLNGIDDVIRHDPVYHIEEHGLNVVDTNSTDCQYLYEEIIGSDSFNVNLPREAPKNLEESIDVLMSVTSKEIKNWAKCLSDQELNLVLHHSLGQNIRNRWKLWRKSDLSNYMNGLGIYHPDDMSSVILDIFQRRLKGEDVRLEEQIQYYQEFWKGKQ